MSSSNKRTRKIVLLLKSSTYRLSRQIWLVGAVVDEVAQGVIAVGEVSGGREMSKIKT